MKRFLFLFSIISIQFNLSAQSHNPSFSVESGAVISTGKHAPFWFYSNQYGKISTKNNSIYLMPSIYRNFKEGSNFDYSYNLSPLLRYDGLGRSYMHQWYGELKFHFIHFTAGAKEEFYGNQDSTLSSGCIIWSKNARPMPKLKLEVPNYTHVPFTWKYLEFKGGMAHGWFDDNEYNKNVWLHHKYFYLRLGGKLPVHVSYGLHHFAQWGGTNLPQNLEAFKSIFFGRSGSSISNSPETDSLNKLGNHIGSRNFGIEIKLKATNVVLYWQNLFEDGSGKAYRNIKDGLFGFSLQSIDKKKLISGFSYELLNTKDQSGKMNEIDSIDQKSGRKVELGGNDNYFNNGLYIKGWSFHEMTIGTPLITSPIILNNRFDYIRNNKVLAHYIGIMGKIRELNYKASYLFSFLYGTNYYPISPAKTQSSFILEFNREFKSHVQLSFKFSFDNSNFYGNNAGLNLRIIKQW